MLKDCPKETCVAISSLKGCLPRFDTADSISYDDERYKAYFDHYGFNQLDGLFERYHFGAVGAEFSIACHYWRTTQSQRTVMLIHGLFDHSALMLPLARHLLGQGVDVVAIDLPEHGLSAKQFGELQSFTEYSDALASVVAAIESVLETPLTLIGHSTGAAAAYDFLQKRAKSNSGSTSIDQLVMLAPLLRIRNWWVVKTSYQLFARFLRRVPRSFQACSHDELFCQFQQHADPLQSRVISTAWIGAMIAREREFYANTTLSTPTLLIQGDDDATVDAAYNIERYRDKVAQLQVVSVQGAKHHLVRELETWRSEVYYAIGEFLRG